LKRVEFKGRLHIRLLLGKLALFLPEAAENQMSAPFNIPAQKHVWRILAISSAIVFAYATVLVKLGHDWWTDENYSHGLLIPFIIAYIVWSQRERFERTAQRPAIGIGLTVIVMALFALWAGTAGAELFMQRISLVLILAATVLYFWGFTLLRLLVVPLFLLLLAIPIPAIVFNKIAFPLQLFASRCAVWAMMAFDIPVLRQGNVIELMPRGAIETKKLEVVEACSGIRSLMTLVTLAVVFAYFTHPRGGNGTDGENSINDLKTKLPSFSARIISILKSYGFWRSTVIVLSAIPIAIFTNAFRVSGTGVLAHYYGTKVADGFFHSFSGWVIYIVAFLMLFGVGWILDRMKPVPENPLKPQSAKASSQTSIQASAVTAPQLAQAEGRNQ
jgi:exosortase